MGFDSGGIHSENYAGPIGSCISNMTGMKKLPSEMLNELLRDGVVQRPDELDAEEFLARARMLLRLAKGSQPHSDYEGLAPIDVSDVGTDWLDC